MSPTIKVARQARSLPCGSIRPAKIPVTPAMRPLSSISRTAESPISAPPIAAEIGVKLPMLCLVTKVRTERSIAVIARQTNNMSSISGSQQKAPHALHRSAGDRRIACSSARIYRTDCAIPRCGYGRFFRGRNVRSEDERRQPPITRNCEMKFYDCSTAPSPRRVRIFLAEKGISVPTVQVDLRSNEQLTPAFRAINPDATVPSLELDDGTRINDAIGICVYFEAIQPQPALMGEGAAERALVTSWQREVERNGVYAVMDAFRNATPGFKGRALPGPHDYEQIPALAERGRLRVAHFFE